MPTVLLVVVLPCIAGLLCPAPSLCDDTRHQAPTVSLPEHTIDSLMLKAINEGLIPGGVVCIIQSDSIIFHKAYGYRQLVPDTLPMTIETTFDLASLSKPVGTAMALMTLAEEGKVDLNAPVSRYLPQYEGNAHVVHLLTHTSGLPAYMNPEGLRKRYGAPAPQALMDSICRCRRLCNPGEKEIYSCLNYIVLQHIIQSVSHEEFALYVQKHVFDALGMHHTGYGSTAHNVASTEILHGTTIPLCGITHDPLARIMNDGKSGNAGVFSTSGDLAKLTLFLLNNKQDPVVWRMTHVPDSLTATQCVHLYGHESLQQRTHRPTPLH